MLNNYNEALEFLRNDKSGKAFFSGNKSSKLLKMAEEKLSIEFSQMYRMFLSEFGAGSYGAIEILGIIDENFEDSCVPDGIWYTLSERQISKLPNNLLIIYEAGNGDLYCQDYGSVTNSEPKIVIYSAGSGEQTIEVVSNNFGEFLIELLNTVI